MNVKLLPKNSKYLVLNIRVSFERFEGSDFWFRNSCFTIIRFPFYLWFIMGFCFKSGSKWFMTISWKLVSVLLNGSKKELVYLISFKTVVIFCHCSLPILPIFCILFTATWRDLFHVVQWMFIKFENSSKGVVEIFL